MNTLYWNFDIFLSQHANVPGQFKHEKVNVQDCFKYVTRLTKPFLKQLVAFRPNGNSP